MQIYKNLPTELQSLVREYYRPIHPNAMIIKEFYEKFFQEFRNNYFINNGIELDNNELSLYFNCDVNEDLLLYIPKLFLEELNLYKSYLLDDSDDETDNETDFDYDDYNRIYDPELNY